MRNHNVFNYNIICDRYLIDTAIDFKLAFPDEKIKKWFQGFLQKPVDEFVFLKEVARFLKHETSFTKEDDSSYEFSIPENLSKDEFLLLRKIYKRFQEWHHFMPVSQIQEEVPALNKKLMNTKLNVFIPILERIMERAEKFDVKVIHILLPYFIEKIKSYFERSGDSID